MRLEYKAVEVGLGKVSRAGRGRVGGIQLGL